MNINQTTLSKISLDAPNIGDLELQYLKKAVDSTYVSSVGPMISEFESSFGNYLSAPNTVATQSGTAALHMALYELGIKQGDEVIVPALTFVASVNPIIYVGAKPVFVDVDETSWNIDPKKIEENITDRTKAIVVVHLYGNPCAMEEIEKIAEKYNLHIIEDATESLGATYDGRQTGTIGDFGCFSFNGNKIITTGGGGMIVSKDTKAAEHIRFLINQARDESRGYYYTEIGFNYRMTNIEAALGLAQMQKLETLLERKKEIHDIYRNELAAARQVSFQESYKQALSSYWFTCIKLNEKIDLSQIQQKLKVQGVPTRNMFVPIVEFPPYKEYKTEDFENAYKIYNHGLCLPSSTLNTKENIVHVCNSLKEVLGE